MSDQRYYDLVASELQSRTIKTGLWARAVAEVGGEGPAARARYIKLRVVELEAEDRSRRGRRDRRAGESSGSQYTSGEATANENKVVVWVAVGAILGAVIAVLFFGGH